MEWSMYISRGFNRSSEDSASAGEPPPPQTLEFLLMHDRLSALERIARLRELGVLTEAEYLIEKDSIMQLPFGELVLRNPLPATPAGPSLLGRLAGWKILAVGALLGLALAWVAQPEETAALLARIAGA